MRLLQNPRLMLLSIPAILWGLCFHEFCHGFAAKMVGDTTAERSGRLSLNPLDHLDLVGTLMLLFAGFGWAKPVPIDTRYFRNPRRDLIIVSLAGIVGNLLTAIVVVLFLRAFGGFWISATGRSGIIVLTQMININIGLAAFNLIPIPPLDGSKILQSLLPHRFQGHYAWFEMHGSLILLVLLVTGTIDVFFEPIFRVLWKLLPL